MQTASQTSQQHNVAAPARISLEYTEGQQAYADGIDGYAATPYPECTQEMTDWFAGWVYARNADREEQVAA